MAAQRNGWSDDDKARLRDLAKKGRSLGAMLSAFPGRSDRAIYGALHRMGLTVGGKPAPSTKRSATDPQLPGARAAVKASLDAVSSQLAGAVAKSAAPVLLGGEPKTKRRPADPAGLPQRRGCAWIEGDPRGRATDPDLFCGADLKPGSSYCPGHHARCHERVRQAEPFVRRQRSAAELARIDFEGAAE